MKIFSNAAVPVFIVLTIMIALFKRVDVWSAFLIGCKKGLNCALEIFPSVFALVIAIDLLSSSGALDAFCSLISPLCSFLGIPPQIFPLSAMRTISGSGATAVFQNILTRHGADSYIGRCAAIIMGSTETTFYTIAVYFAATRVKNTRYCLFCALLADLCGSIAGCAVCHFIYY